MNRRHGALVFVSVVGLSPGARAQGAEPPPQTSPAPGYHVYYPQQRPAPPPPTGVRKHDRLFLRFGLGYSYLSTAITQTRPDNGITGTIEAHGLGMDLLIGGSPVPGLALGGALLVHGYPDPKMERVREDGGKVYGDTSVETLTFSLIGVFGQYYFDPKSGAYLQALLGVGRLDESNDDDAEENPGLAFGAGGGYDFWIGEQWSLGPELRLMYAPLTHRESEPGTKYNLEVKADYDTTVFSLMLTITNH